MLGVADFLVRNQKFLHDKRSGRRFFRGKRKCVIFLKERRKVTPALGPPEYLFSKLCGGSIYLELFFFKRAPVFVWEIAFNCPSLSKNGLLAALIVLSSPFSRNETKRQKAFRFFLVRPL